ncbi:MAG: 3-hydroxyacyl-ACP dehydratase FabZ [Bosea sp. (in: a-proteobacteria)]
MLDIQKILEYMPHRYPFLLVDRIINIDGDNSCIGIKNVTANEPQFMGHFPGKPLFPGVLIIEGMAQTAGAVVVHAMSEDKRRTPTVLFTTIDKAKFRKQVIPGDQMQYRMRKIAHRRSIFWFRGEAYVGDQLVAEAELSAMLLVP